MQSTSIALVLDGILQQLIASVLMGLDRVLGHHEVYLCSGAPLWQALSLSFLSLKTIRLFRSRSPD